jgi:transcription factor WhiB
VASNLPAPVPGPVTDYGLWARVVRYAQCASSGLDPDEWFPASIEPATARHEGAAAIAVCTACLVRAECLALSLRHWDVGQHGIWGGLVPADRARLRRLLPACHGRRRRTTTAGREGVAAVSRAAHWALEAWTFHER